MINVMPIPYKGIEEILENIEFYKKKFIDESVIVFRNANMSLTEQENFNKKIGEKIGWIPYEIPNSHYQENHSHNEAISKTGPDDIMLRWHIEHPYYSNPIVVGMWNMFKLTAPIGAGKTYFMNTSIIYDRLNIDETNFLNSCTLIGPKFKEVTTFYQNVEYSAISNHWLTRLPTIRIPLNRNCENVLGFVNNVLPTEKEEKKFENILYKIIEMIESDESIRIVHTWNQGDLVLMDGSLAHAVTGGFSPEDREFYGMWGHRDHIKYGKQ
jgi:alpha-ketoglutarate-dependent taurine dioxygenase